MEWEVIYHQDQPAYAIGTTVTQLKFPDGRLIRTTMWKRDGYHNVEFLHMSTTWAPFTESQELIMVDPSPQELSRLKELFLTQPPSSPTSEDSR